MEAVGVVGPETFGPGFELPIYRAVDHIAKAGRTVVEVVVVIVVAIFVADVPAKEIVHRQLGSRFEIEFLRPDRAPQPLVGGQGAGPIGLAHGIAEVFLRKPGNEPDLLPPGPSEIEPAVVVGDIRAGPVVDDPNGVVPETLPDQIAGIEGQEIDGQFTARNGIGRSGLDRRRGYAGHEEKRRQPTHRAMSRPLASDS